MTNGDLRSLRTRVESMSAVFKDDTNASRFGDYVIEQIDELMEDADK